MDSLLVRTSWPSLPLILGSEPPSLHRASSWFVPGAPAETRCRAFPRTSGASATDQSLMPAHCGMTKNSGLAR
jgi:hypothetical protein